MLTAVKKKTHRAKGQTFAIVASQYNAKYVDAMLRAATAELRRAGVRRILVVRVPGAFEIPVIAARLARRAWSGRPGTPAQSSLAALICLGVILRGETTHAAHIAEAVTMSLARIQVRYELPVIHQVLLLKPQAQPRLPSLARPPNPPPHPAPPAPAT